MPCYLRIRGFGSLQGMDFNEKSPLIDCLKESLVENQNLNRLKYSLINFFEKTNHSIILGLLT